MTSTVVYCSWGYEPEIENYLYCEFLTNDIEYYDLRDGQQPTINLYSVPDDAIYEQWALVLWNAPVFIKL